MPGWDGVILIAMYPRRSGNLRLKLSEQTAWLENRGMAALSYRRGSSIDSRACVEREMVGAFVLRKLKIGCVVHGQLFVVLLQRQ